jgi:hypothetical protein
MTSRTARTFIQTSAAAALFAGGVLVGTTLQRPVEAQVGDLMKQAGQAAVEQGGALGAASKLATSITGLQQHVNDLQKDVEGLKKIQALLGG